MKESFNQSRLMCCFAHKLTQIVQILPDACVNHAPVNADNKSSDNGRVDFKQQLNALACDFFEFCAECIHFAVRKRHGGNDFRLGNAVFGIVEELKLIRTFGKTVNIAAFRKQLDKIIHIFRNPAVQSIVNGSQSVFERNIGAFSKS